MKRFWLLALLMAGTLASLGSPVLAADDSDMEDINSALGSMAAHMNDIDKALHLKFSGDLRIRYAFITQNSSMTGVTILDQSLGRYRARFGATMTRGDFTGKFRISTGSTAGGPWSENNTFDTGMVNPAINIDTASIDWKPSFANGMLLFTAGKMGNPLTKTVITWDPDFQPEGALVEFKKADFTLRATYFELANQATVGAQKWDFFMDNVQAEYNLKLDDSSALGLMAGYEYIPNSTLLSTNGLGYSTAVFTTGVADPGGVFRDFNVVEGMLTLKHKMGDVPMKWTFHVTDNLNGLNLPDATGPNGHSSTFTNQYAWLFGVDIGSTSNPGDFAGSLFVAQTDPNSQLPILVDDDSGRTNTQYLAGSLAALLESGVTLKLTQWVNGREYYALVATSKHDYEFRTYLDCILNL